VPSAQIHSLPHAQPAKLATLRVLTQLHALAAQAAAQSAPLQALAKLAHLATIRPPVAHALAAMIPVLVTLALMEQLLLHAGHANQATIMFQELAVLPAQILELLPPAMPHPRILPTPSSAVLIQRHRPALLALTSRTIAISQLLDALLTLAPTSAQFASLDITLLLATLALHAQSLAVRFAQLLLHAQAAVLELILIALQPLLAAPLALKLDALLALVPLQLHARPALLDTS
jgi:hypothetical protein